MVHIDRQPRPELLVAALLYLITAYRRSRCPGLAACIARHLEHLAAHPKADRVLTDIAAASMAEWDTAAAESPVASKLAPKKNAFGLAWH